MEDRADKPFTGDWYDERNARRRELYRTDPEYRKRTNKQSRDTYREGKCKGVPFDPTTNIDLIRGEKSVGKLRTLIDGKENVLTFTKEEVSQIFQRPVKQIQGWAYDGRIPDTRLSGRVPGVERVWLSVYSAAEVYAMVKSLGPFLADLLYLRKDNIEAIRSCREAVHNARYNEDRP